MGRFAISDGILVDGKALKAFSPSKGTWVTPSMAFADMLDAKGIPDSEAERLMRDPSSLTEPAVKSS